MDLEDRAEHYIKAGDFYFKNGDFPEAYQNYKIALGLAPNDPTPMDKMEDCGIGRYDQQIERARKREPAAVSGIQQARLRFVIECFERRVKARPEELALQFELGKCYYAAGPSFLEKATMAFEKSVEDPQRKRDSHLFLGMAYQKQKLFKQAEVEYRKVEAGPLSKEKKLMILYNRAQCFREMADRDKEAEIIDQIRKIEDGGGPEAPSLA